MKKAFFPPLKVFLLFLFYIINIEEGNIICFLIFQDLSTDMFALVCGFTKSAYRQALCDMHCIFLCPFHLPFLRLKE